MSAWDDPARPGYYLQAIGLGIGPPGPIKPPIIYARLLGAELHVFDVWVHPAAIFLIRGWRAPR